MYIESNIHDNGTATIVLGGVTENQAAVILQKDFVDCLANSISSGDYSDNGDGGVLVEQQAIADYFANRAREVGREAGIPDEIIEGLLSA